MYKQAIELLCDGGADELVLGDQRRVDVGHHMSPAPVRLPNLLSEQALLDQTATQCGDRALCEVAILQPLLDLAHGGGAVSPERAHDVGLARGEERCAPLAFSVKMRSMPAALSASICRAGF